MNLLLIAHGSRDPRYTEAFETLCLRLRREGHRARVGYLGLCGPDPAQAAAGLGAELAAAGAAPGEEPIVAVPMFLNQGYHVQHDVPAAVMTARAAVVARAGILLAAHLGPDPLLAEALDSRLRELGVWPGDPETAVVLASAGTSDAAARTVLERAAAAWEQTGWHSVLPAYAAAAAPNVGEAVAAARAGGAAEVVIAGLFLAPGLLADRVALGAPGVPMSAPLLTPECAEPALVRLVLRRAREAVAAASGAAASGAPGAAAKTTAAGARTRAGRRRPGSRSGSALRR